jgi:hypothetical protein
LLTPAICFLCENSPQQEAMKVVDTRREFNPQGLSALSGRKYFCQGCCEDLGAAMGMVKKEELLVERAYRIEAEAQVVELEGELIDARTQQNRVVAVDEISDYLNSLTNKPAPKPRATPKPA